MKTTKLINYDDDLENECERRKKKKLIRVVDAAFLAMSMNPHLPRLTL